MPFSFSRVFDVRAVVAESIPHAGNFAVLVPRALNLIRGGSRPPYKKSFENTIVFSTSVNQCKSVSDSIGNALNLF